MRYSLKKTWLKHHEKKLIKHHSREMHALLRDWYKRSCLQPGMDKHTLDCAYATLKAQIDCWETLELMR